MRKADEIFDEWLVLQCQSGNAAVLSVLVQRWQPRLLGFAVRLLADRDAAEDVVQSSWVVIVKRIHSLRDPTAVRSWMFRIVANKCADVIRQRTKRRQKISTAIADDLADPHDANRRAESQRSDQVLEMRRVLKGLDPLHREVLHLHYSENHSLAEIAQRLSVPIGTVKSRMHHARNKLKQTLSGEKNE